MHVGISPLRISFAGGGTDMPEYFEKFGGHVISSTINLFTNVVFNQRHDDSFQAFSPDYEHHHKVSNFENLELLPGTEIAVSVVKHLNYKLGADYFICSDVQPGSGLGGSSSLTVNCVNTIQKLMKKNLDKEQIAEMSFDIERNKLEHPIGKQDNYIAAFGGLNFIKFEKDNVEVIPISLSKSSMAELNNNLMLFFLGTTRKSSDVLSQQLTLIKENDQNTMNSLHEVKDLVNDLYDSFKSNDITQVAEIMHKGWIAKKKFTKDVSNKRIDEIYAAGIESGAIGGKITGAGGGGHILFYCESQKQQTLKEKMESLGLIHIPFKFYEHGPKVLNLYEQI
tara:strand:- start:5244 stop:6257 length:1014 start_codon:yes stop_codon:yes gene_type:complete